MFQRHFTLACVEVASKLEPWDHVDWEEASLASLDREALTPALAVEPSLAAWGHQGDHPALGQFAGVSPRGHCLPSEPDRRSELDLHFLINYMCTALVL